MPTLVVRTNLTLTPEQKQQSLAALSKLITGLVPQEEVYVQVVFQDGLTLSFGGSPAPTVFLDFRIIGCISLEANKKTSAGLTKYFTDTYAVPPGRIYISFNDIPAENWGSNGGTVG
jgi:phenylpyruvate tautomerase PptA (4-oxalocrotonate tautomerase family)